MFLFQGFPQSAISWIHQPPALSFGGSIPCPRQGALCNPRPPKRSSFVWRLLSHVAVYRAAERSGESPHQGEEFPLSLTRQKTFVDQVQGASFFPYPSGLRPLRPTRFCEARGLRVPHRRTHILLLFKNILQAFFSTFFKYFAIFYKNADFIETIF